MTCDVCGNKLPEMTPKQAAEAEARALAEALILGGIPAEPDRVLVCDPCWQRALRNGWDPNRGRKN
jgi:hypothetical protein